MVPKSYLFLFSFLFGFLYSSHAQNTPQNALKSLQITPSLDTMVIQDETAFVFAVGTLQMEFYSDLTQEDQNEFTVLLDFGNQSSKKNDFIDAYLAENNTQVHFHSAFLIDSCDYTTFPLFATYSIIETNTGLSSNFLDLTINCESRLGQASNGEEDQSGSFSFVLFIVLVLSLAGLLSLCFFVLKRRKRIDYTLQDYQPQCPEEKIDSTEASDRKIQDEIATHNQNLLKRKRKNRKTGSSQENSNSFEEENNKSLDFPPHETKDDSEKMGDVKELNELSHIHNTTVFKPDLSISYSIVNEIKDSDSKQLFSENRPIMEELNE